MRYQFQSEYGQHSWKPRMFATAIKILISANIIMFILKALTVDYVNMVGSLGLSPQTIWPMVWQPLTYMFIHGDFWHVAINMFVLWMFGSELEVIWGQKSFLKYYFITGIGSGLVWTLFNIGSHYSVLIGASGAIYGILIAYGMLFPNRTVYLYFLIPIKVKWLVLIIGGVAFFSSFNDMSNISHMTHLSGMLIGYVYLKKEWQWSRLSILFRKKVIDVKSAREDRKIRHIQAAQQDLDRILDKINESGMDSLNEEEKNILYSSSKRLSKKKPRD